MTGASLVAILLGMGKAKIALKYKPKETAPQLPAYRVGGNVIDGYTVLTRSDRELARYENVRDAVAQVNRLLSGEEVEPAEEETETE